MIAGRVIAVLELAGRHGASLPVILAATALPALAATPALDALEPSGWVRSSTKALRRLYWLKEEPRK